MVFFPLTSMVSETSRTSGENRSQRVNFSTGENMLTLPPSHAPSFRRYRAGVNLAEGFSAS